jgi:hypothetical protein
MENGRGRRFGPAASCPTGTTPRIRRRSCLPGGAGRPLFTPDGAFPAGFVPVCGHRRREKSRNRTARSRRSRVGRAGGGPGWAGKWRPGHAGRRRSRWGGRAPPGWAGRRRSRVGGQVAPWACWQAFSWWGGRVPPGWAGRRRSRVGGQVAPWACWQAAVSVGGQVFPGWARQASPRVGGLASLGGWAGGGFGWAGRGVFSVSEQAPTRGSGRGGLSPLGQADVDKSWENLYHRS